MDFSIVGSVLRGFGELYFLVALGLLTLALVKPKEKKEKILWTSTVLILFGTLPAINLWMGWRHDVYSKEAWAYFKKMCAERAGEKIYKTFSGVRSVVVAKPLPPATEKDLYDQYWLGDPYTSATPWEKRGESVAARLVASSVLPSGKRQKGLDFVEIRTTEEGRSVVRRIDRPASIQELPITRAVTESTSKFGVSWEDISSREDRSHWVAGSRFRVIDLSDNSIVAERIGFLIEHGFGSKSGQRRPWLNARGPKTSCPQILSDYADQQFLMRVLSQESENQ